VTLFPTSAVSPITIADHDSHAVIYEKVFSDGRTGMDFDPCDTASRLGYPTRKEFEIMLPKFVG